MQYLKCALGLPITFVGACIITHQTTFTYFRCGNLDYTELR